MEQEQLLDRFSGILKGILIEKEKTEKELKELERLINKYPKETVELFPNIGKYFYAVG